MDFAKRILNKYGWKDGDGLGKNNDGIVKPLKASMKFDNAGLGADQAASDFNNHWWERVFNEAASNVDIKEDENGVKMDLKNHEDTVEISTKGYSMKKLKKAKRSTDNERNDLHYDNFLQSVVLTESGGEIENPDKISVADIEVTRYKTLTDEELFQACGGRTAHKGARHGLKLSGKLSRLERQEKELLKKMVAKKEVADKYDPIHYKLEDVTVETTKLKRKKRKNSDCGNNEEIRNTERDSYQNDQYVKINEKNKNYCFKSDSHVIRISKKQKKRRMFK